MRALSVLWRTGAYLAMGLGLVTAPLVLPATTLLWLFGLGAASSLALHRSGSTVEVSRLADWLHGAFGAAFLGGAVWCIVVVWLVQCGGFGLPIVVLVVPVAYPRLVAWAFQRGRELPAWHSIRAGVRRSTATTVADLSDRQLWDAWRQSGVELGRPPTSRSAVDASNSAICISTSSNADFRRRSPTGSSRGRRWSASPAGELGRIHDERLASQRCPAVIAHL